MPRLARRESSVWFIDGVRRLEARVTAKSDDQYFYGAFGAYAVGAVHLSDLQAGFERFTTGRILALSSSDLPPGEITLAPGLTAADWEWSSAAAHAAGSDMDGLLRLDVWRELFGKPERAAEAWVEYLEAPAEEAAANAARTLAAKLTFAPYNRPVGWAAPAAPDVALRVGEAPS